MYPTRTLDAVVDLLTQIVVKDLSRPFFESDIYNIMLTHPQADDKLQLQIVSRILKYFNRKPKIDNLNLLVNLHRVFSNLSKLMEEDEIISLRVISLINLIAFKSTTDVRRMIKENKLLELRDRLMVD